jgi:hypothetical protein
MAGFADDRQLEAVSCKAGYVFFQDGRLFMDGQGQVINGSGCFIGSSAAFDDFDERNQGGRIEPVHADEPFRLFYSCRQAIDGKTARIGSDEGILSGQC